MKQRLQTSIENQNKAVGLPFSQTVYAPAPRGSMSSLLWKKLQPPAIAAVLDESLLGKEQLSQLAYCLNNVTIA